MRIGIIDDEKPARSELMYLIKEIVPNAVIQEMESGEEALKLIASERFDLLCIDINLGDISGISLAAAARKLIPEAEIVFATAYNNYADKAFEVDALYYLLKPFSEEKVKQMLDKYIQKHGKCCHDYNNLYISKIPLNVDKRILLVEVPSIVYIESQNRVCIIHTKEKSYKDNNPLNYFEEKLGDKGFFRIQKSYLINLNYVLEIYPWFSNTYCVKMEGFKDEVLPISRNQIKNLKNILCI
ncbi:MAG: LytTR family DNA-binding domain-containing protein [Anaerocolumna aminovalerica]|uniref:LytR/AlgR family response regulator transcription factor n=1 Tax=Anaerocolumna aminovalerica TaxID=1527 RepID=UPI00248ADAAC|nr:LytTR family DNA-binding domain-containing protein [Anaerocolumna aminovalerica]MDU6264274.1 LytTR family DNA-binding domain-containing protein [Anaerocolumna aminovalerica]